MNLAPTIEEELWRRAEARREANLYPDAAPSDRLLLPLVMSLARLAAQRDAKLIGGVAWNSDHA
jgi:hypothetical protein